ncbi:MAG: hypothetical protein D6772_13155 [Bacteroidetes bacterium]|nr:MAG: hypothetical protein D6772_13155 [Bacteroidota bacterium]
MTTISFLLDNAPKIMGLLIALASLIVSPIVLLRYLRTRNELTEIQTFVKKNRVIREEIAKLSKEIDSHSQRIRVLETELHQMMLEKLSLEAENERLRQQLEQFIAENDSHE